MFIYTYELQLQNHASAHLAARQPPTKKPTAKITGPTILLKHHQSLVKAFAL